MILMDFLFVFFGGYVIYQTMKMKNEKKIPSFLINSRVNLERAKDKEGYINYMTPRLILFGILIIAFSLLSVAADIFALPPVVSIISFVAYIAVLVFFSIMSVKAQTKYLFK